MYLVEHLHEVPLHVIPCIQDAPTIKCPPRCMRACTGSIFPAVWNFQLALRSRGLGSTLTTLHLLKEREAAELLGIPDDVMQVALLPVGYTIGTDFKPRDPPARRQHHALDTW